MSKLLSRCRHITKAMGILAMLSSCNDLRDAQAKADTAQAVQADIIAFGEEYAPQAQRALIAVENEVAERALLLSDYESKLIAAGESPAADVVYRQRTQDLEQARGRLRQLTDARKRAYLAMQAAHLEPQRESPDEQRAHAGRAKAAVRELEQLTDQLQGPVRSQKSPDRRDGLSAPAPQAGAARRSLPSAPGPRARLGAESLPPASAVAEDAPIVEAPLVAPPTATPKLAPQGERQVLRAPPPSSARQTPLWGSPLLTPHDDSARPLQGVH
ncbi:MAG: hypothetical protein RLZZ450_1034 [Pseudomonadota bacterium]|jgi:hypothetical protein